MSAGLMVMEFRCLKDSPSIKELVAGIATPHSLDAIPSDSPNLKLIATFF
jgi:hypothetical protein